jgi:ribonuclease P/MRP protein subunit POP3
MTVVPPPPEISSFIAVGLNSIARSLESSSRRSRPNIQATEGGGDGELPATVDKSREPDAKQGFRVDAKHPLEGHFSVIFVCRSSQSTVLYEHLPQLLYTASLAHPELPATRLVELPNSSEARLCEALGIPRVSFIGIFDGAPHSKSLVDLVRECVPKIEIPWLQQAKESKYLPVKITAIETFSTVAKKGKA